MGEFGDRLRLRDPNPFDHLGRMLAAAGARRLTFSMLIEANCPPGLRHATTGVKWSCPVSMEGSALGNQAAC